MSDREIPDDLLARLYAIVSRPALRRAPRLADDITVLVRDARLAGRRQFARELLPLLRKAKAGDRQDLLDAMGLAYTALAGNPDRSESEGSLA
jgi:hypothetical protein